MKRIETLREYMGKNNISATWVTKPEDIYYYSGFTGSTGSALITEDALYFFADFRYTKQVSQQCVGYTIKEVSAKKNTVDYLKELVVGTLAYEDQYMSVFEYNALKSAISEERLVPLKNTITVLRAIKDEEEIVNLRQAAAIADKGFLHVLDIVKPGMTEKELALELEFFMRKQGASGLSFTTIVASGIRSSMPHGVASDKVIEKNDMLTLDFGCMYNGYCSDMTRTFVVGTADDRQKELYNIVLETQLKVLDAIKPGARCKEIDALSREIIGGYGYGEFYGHGLGHGVGLEIHELPVLNGTSEFVLEENMVVTDEPGIYLPDFGGVRIEDTVLVTKDGYDLISRSTKEFIEIK